MVTDRHDASNNDVRDLIPGIEPVVHRTIGELRNQVQQWGPQEHDDVRWAAILLEKIGEAMCASEDLSQTAVSEAAILGRAVERAMAAGEIARYWLGGERGASPKGSSLATELVQVAAVALQWAAAIGRRAGQADDDGATAAGKGAGAPVSGTHGRAAHATGGESDG